MKDLYALLGVTRSSDERDVKRAYRMLALKYHPEKNLDNPAAKEKFDEISQAFDILSNLERRAVYDQWGLEGVYKGTVKEEGPTEKYEFTSGRSLEIFKAFFGTANPFSTFGFADTVPYEAAFREDGPKKHAAVENELPCSLEELYSGSTKRVTITRKRYNNEKQLEESSKTLTIIIKPGFKKGTKFTFPGEGDEGPGTIPSDVVFTLVEKKHDNFERDGHDLIHTSKISLAEALTDCVVKVPTLDGRKLAVSCNEVVYPGYEKVVPGEGMPSGKNGAAKGNLKIRFAIEFPKYLSDSKRVEIKKLLLNPERELS